MPVFEQSATPPELPPGPSPSRRLRSHGRISPTPTRSWSSRPTRRGSPRSRAPRPRRTIIQIGDRSALLALPDPRLRRRPGARRRPAPHPGRAGRGRARHADEPAVAERAGSAGRPSTGELRDAWAAKAARGAEADAPIDMAWVSRCIGDVHRRRHDRRQRVRPRHHADALARARQSTSARRRPRRPRLGAGRRARRQAGRARQDGHLLRGRRRLHLRHADGRPLDGAGPRPARALRGLQQPRLERGEALRRLARATGGWAVRTGHAARASSTPRPTTR